MQLQGREGVADRIAAVVAPCSLGQGAQRLDVQWRQDFEEVGAALWRQGVTVIESHASTLAVVAKAVIDAANAQWPDARKITEADARTWLKALVTPERGAYTVATIWRSALKTLCNWAVDEGSMMAREVGYHGFSTAPLLSDSLFSDWFILEQYNPFNPFFVVGSEVVTQQMLRRFNSAAERCYITLIDSGTIHHSQAAFAIQGFYNTAFMRAMKSSGRTNTISIFLLSCITPSNSPSKWLINYSTHFVPISIGLCM